MLFILRKQRENLTYLLALLQTSASVHPLVLLLADASFTGFLLALAAVSLPQMPVQRKCVRKFISRNLINQNKCFKSKMAERAARDLCVLQTAGFLEPEPEGRLHRRHASCCHQACFHHSYYIFINNNNILKRCLPAFSLKSAAGFHCAAQIKTRRR